MTLTSPRSALAPSKISDIDSFMVWVFDEKVPRFCTWEAYDNKEKGLDYIKNINTKHSWFNAICLDNKPIGAISVTPNLGNDQCRGELGNILGSMYWGKGIATQAVKLVADTIFKEWTHLDRLEALVDVDNVGSQRLLEKVGFQREVVLRKYFTLRGRCRDMVILSLLSTHWQT